MTTRQIRFYYLTYQQQEQEQQDRMQWAVTQAIASAFANKGHRPGFWSYLFQGYTDDPHERTDRPFPHDVTFLSRADLDNIAKLDREYGHHAWSLDRLEAYRGTDILAKRAAVSAFLWQRYIEDPGMTLDRLNLWHEIEQLDEFLRVPTEFRQQHLGPDVLEVWKHKMGDRYAQAQIRHQRVMQAIQDTWSSDH